MRKTMIFRSDRLWLVAMGLLAGTSAAAAQDPATVQRPSVHVVQEGETLWALAERYFGDPFLWPEIYRLNTLVVEDPHWIFPGEELRLDAPPPAMMEPAAPPPTDPQAVPQPAQPPTQEPTQAPTPQAPAPQQPVAPRTPAPPPAPTGPTIFRVEEAQVRASGLVTATRVYRPVRRGEFYSAGFLTENELLPYGRVVRSVGQVELSRLPDASSTLLFGTIEILPPVDATYQVNDSLLIVRMGHNVKGWGGVVVPTGIARVTAVSEEGAYAEVIQQYDPISSGQSLLPLEPFIDPGSVVPVPVQGGLEGVILDSKNRSSLPNQQDVVFIDRGRSDGVALGDVFVMMNKPNAGMIPTDTIGIMQIVHRRENSASGVISFIRSIGVQPGAVVRLFRKMPT